MINIMKLCAYPDSKVHGDNMGPSWVLSAPAGPHVGPMNLAIRVPPWKQQPEILAWLPVELLSRGFYWRGSASCLIGASFLDWLGDHQRRSHCCMKDDCPDRTQPEFMAAYHTMLYIVIKRTCSIKETGWLLSSEAVLSIVCLIVVMQYVYCIIWCMCPWDILQSFKSQHGGCWWPAANLAPGHLQPSWWHRLVGCISGFPQSNILISYYKTAVSPTQIAETHGSTLIRHWSCKCVGLMSNQRWDTTVLL